MSRNMEVGFKRSNHHVFEASSGNRSCSWPSQPLCLALLGVLSGSWSRSSQAMCCPFPLQPCWLWCCPWPAHYPRSSHMRPTECSRRAPRSVRITVHWMPQYQTRAPWNLAPVCGWWHLRLEFTQLQVPSCLEDHPMTDDNVVNNHDDRKSPNWVTFPSKWHRPKWLVHRGYYLTNYLVTSPGMILQEATKSTTKVISKLVGGWIKPFEKYVLVKNWIIFPQGSEWKFPNIFELPPPRKPWQALLHHHQGRSLSTWRAPKGWWASPPTGSP